jgi:hypothetical protein
MTMPRRKSKKYDPAMPPADVVQSESVLVSPSGKRYTILETSEVDAYEKQPHAVTSAPRPKKRTG